MHNPANIKNFGEIKRADGDYNSIMDQINRNYSMTKFKYYNNMNVDEAWEILVDELKQFYKFRKDLEEGNEFGVRYPGITLKFKVEELNLKKHFVTFTWKNEQDFYWTTFQIKQSNIFKKKIAFRYTESILRELTIWGMTSSIGLYYYKKAYHKTFKWWRKNLTNAFLNHNQKPVKYPKIINGNKYLETSTKKTSSLIR